MTWVAIMEMSSTYETSCESYNIERRLILSCTHEVKMTRWRGNGLDWCHNDDALRGQTVQQVRGQPQRTRPLQTSNQKIKFSKFCRNEEAKQRNSKQQEARSAKKKVKMKKTSNIPFFLFYFNLRRRCRMRPLGKIEETSHQSIPSCHDLSYIAVRGENTSGKSDIIKAGSYHRALKSDESG